jgi:hypothetical protein
MIGLGLPYSMRNSFETAALPPRRHHLGALTHTTVLGSDAHGLTVTVSKPLPRSTKNNAHYRFNVAPTSIWVSHLFSGGATITPTSSSTATPHAHFPARAFDSCICSRVHQPFEIACGLCVVLICMLCFERYECVFVDGHATT